MKSLLITLLFTSSIYMAKAQSPAPTKITLGTQTSGSVQGNLSNGAPMQDLSWAWNSSNACFPATQQRKFTGNHVLYQIDLPAYSEMKVTVVPDDKSADFSLYAYQVGVNTETVVPNLPSCIRCEADHKWDYKKRGQVQDHRRTVKDLVAIASPYKVIIGVAGANGLAEGGFTLQIELTRK